MMNQQPSLGGWAGSSFVHVRTQAVDQVEIGATKFLGPKAYFRNEKARFLDRNPGFRVWVQDWVQLKAKSCAVTFGSDTRQTRYGF